MKELPELTSVSGIEGITGVGATPDVLYKGSDEMYATGLYIGSARKLCLSEDEMITAEGKRIHTGKSSPTNGLFAANFTQHYAELAQRDTVFADMQNIFDLSLVAALIRNERLDERTGWDPGMFAADGAYRPVRYEPPKTVMSVANHRVYNGRDVVVQVAGGVRADLMSVVKDRNVLREAKRLENVVGHGKAPQLPAGRWWWDAAR